MRLYSAREPSRGGARLEFAELFTEAAPAGRLVRCFGPGGDRVARAQLGRSWTWCTCWVDGVYVKAGLEKDNAAVLVAIGGWPDGRKVLITLRSGYRESTESWKGVLRDARQRGLRCPRLVMGDGAPGDWPRSQPT